MIRHLLESGDSLFEDGAAGGYGDIAKGAPGQLTEAHGGEGGKVFEDLLRLFDGVFYLGGSGRPASTW